MLTGEKMSLLHKHPRLQTELQQAGLPFLRRFPDRNTVKDARETLSDLALDKTGQRSVYVEVNHFGVVRHTGLPDTYDWVFTLVFEDGEEISVVWDDELLDA